MDGLIALSLLSGHDAWLREWHQRDQLVMVAGVSDIDVAKQGVRRCSMSCLTAVMILRIHVLRAHHLDTWSTAFTMARAAADRRPERAGGAGPGAMYRMPLSRSSS